MEPGMRRGLGKSKTGGWRVTPGEMTPHLRENVEKRDSGGFPKKIDFYVEFVLKTTQKSVKMRVRCFKSCGFKVSGKGWFFSSLALSLHGTGNHVTN